MKYVGVKSAHQLSQKLGYKQSEKVNRLFRKEQHKPSYKVLCDLSETFPDLNMNWLLLGNGDMLISKLLKSSEKKENPIPIYDILVSAGDNIKFWEDPESIIGYVPREFQGVRDSDVAIYVYGDSMDPAYQAGDMVFLKRLRDHSLINYGQAHVIITDEHRLLKYLMRGRKDQEHVILRSENPQYEDMEIHKGQILRLYRVQGFFRKEGL
ncbi:MAG: S24 family peptidase [Cytophagales bacterium]|nr:S24 family peptidase [Cytophagales bacterium]